MLGPDLQTRVERRLEDGEHLVWYAKPRPSAWFPKWRLLVTSGFFWCSGLVWTFWGALSPSTCPLGGRTTIFRTLITEAMPFTERLFYATFLLPFAAIGIGMLFSPLWHWLGCTRYAYAVTNRRALYIGRLGTRTFRAAELFVPDRADHHNGLSDILFCREIVCMNRRHGLTDSRLIGFRNLPAAEAPAAEAALRALYDQAHPASPLPQHKLRIKPR